MTLALGATMFHQQMDAMLVLVAATVWAARKDLWAHKRAVVVFSISFALLSGMV